VTKETIRLPTVDHPVKSDNLRDGDAEFQELVLQMGAAGWTYCVCSHCKAAGIKKCPHPDCDLYGD
jgi:hypothetical protein